MTKMTVFARIGSLSRGFDPGARRCATKLDGLQLVARPLIRPHKEMCAMRCDAMRDMDKRLVGRQRHHRSGAFLINTETSWLVESI